MGDFMYDVAIIGTGPAGISAALTLKQLNKSFVWFGSRGLSNKIIKAEKINNYPGLSMVSGEQMHRIFLQQIDDMGIEIEEKTVTGVYDLSTHYGILCNQDMYEAKAIILATGVESLKPIKGELEYLGRGVSYCATCDGMLYKNKKIAVVSTLKEFEHEVEFLASLASEVVFIPLYKDDSINIDNVVKIKKMPIEILDSDNKKSLIFKDGEVLVDGVFMLKASISPSALVFGIEAVDGHIVVDRNGKTNLRGCFACGDCTGRPYQYAKAVGEGNVCAHSAVAYLNNL